MPDCCDEPMVHNTSAGRWECGDALFALVGEDDSQVYEWQLGLIGRDDLDPADRPAYDHWAGSFRPCGHPGCIGRDDTMPHCDLCDDYGVISHDVEMGNGRTGEMSVPCPRGCEDQT